MMQITTIKLPLSIKIMYDKGRTTVIDAGLYDDGNCVDFSSFRVTHGDNTTLCQFLQWECEELLLKEIAKQVLENGN